MADRDPKAPTTEHGGSAMNISSKSTAAAPKVSGDELVELADMLPSGPEYSADEDIMQLARIGDTQGIERLYASGKFDPLYCDAEGITPLHVTASLLSRWSFGENWMLMVWDIVGCDQ